MTDHQVLQQYAERWSLWRARNEGDKDGEPTGSWAATRRRPPTPQQGLEGMARTLIEPNEGELLEALAEQNRIEGIPVPQPQVPRPQT